jgi:hypothetical protein
MTMGDQWYSIGKASAGAVCLHNYPNALRNLTRIDGQVTDLATLDIVRDRERGVPRYNDFREALRMPRRKRIEDITPNKQWAKEINEVYHGDVDAVDLQIGMQAEQPPKGFGFSDTAFRIFILMASRRLKSDRFFTTDFTARRSTRRPASTGSTTPDEGRPAPPLPGAGAGHRRRRAGLRPLARARGHRAGQEADDHPRGRHGEVVPPVGLIPR